MLNQARNPYLCLVIVAFMGVALLGGLAGIVFLAAIGKECPDALKFIAGTALGGLGSFMVAVPKVAVGISSPAPPGAGPSDAASTGGRPGPPASIH